MLVIKRSPVNSNGPRIAWIVQGIQAILGPFEFPGLRFMTITVVYDDLNQLPPFFQIFHRKSTPGWFPMAEMMSSGKDCPLAPQSCREMVNNNSSKETLLDTVCVRCNTRTLNFISSQICINVLHSKLGIYSYSIFLTGSLIYKTKIESLNWINRSVWRISNQIWM